MQAPDEDGDLDSAGQRRYDSDHDAILTFGYLANSADAGAVTGLIERYYSAAAAGKAKSACSMLYWLFVESLVEAQNRTSGNHARSGDCTTVASKVFAQQHRELVADMTAIHVAVVRTRGRQGVALVSFGPQRERLVSVHNDRGTWKMNVLLDNGAL